MSEVGQFQFGGRQVRVIDRDGEPWWVARDVCDVLEIENVTRALAGLDDDEKGLHSVKTPGGPQSMAVVSEPGLYALVGRSRKPEARAFDRWVRHEVLPSIRLTGGYQAAPAAALNVELAINALAELAHKEHVVPGAARILAFHRWRKPRKGIEAFVQLTLDVRLPALDEGRREITGGDAAGESIRAS